MQARNVILIMGRTGSGKSVLTKEIIKRSTRKLILDPLHEYTGDNGKIFFSFPELNQYMNDNDLFESGEMNLIFRPNDELDANYFFKLAKTVNRALIVVEEANLYLSRNYTNEDFKWIIFFGRHRNISVLCVARRWSEVTADFRSQADCIISFHQIEPRDIEKLVDYGFEETEITGLNYDNHEWTYLKDLKNPDELEFPS